MAIETINLETLNDRLKQMQIQEERVKELQEAQQQKINQWKDKILQLDFKALKSGLDLGVQESKVDKVIELGLRSPRSDGRVSA